MRYLVCPVASFPCSSDCFTSKGNRECTEENTKAQKGSKEERKEKQNNSVSPPIKCFRSALTFLLIMFFRFFLYLTANNVFFLSLFFFCRLEPLNRKKVCLSYLHVFVSPPYGADTTTMHSEDAAAAGVLLEAKKAAWAAEQLRIAQQADVPQTELFRIRSEEGSSSRRSSSSSPDSPSSFVHTRFALDGLIATLDCGEAAAEISPSWAVLRRQLAHDVAQQAHLTHAPPPLTIIGGIDISFIPNTNDGVACLAVLRYPSLEVVKTYMHHCTLAELYITSFLAFREIQPVCKLFAKVAAELSATGTMPQLLVVDGNGVHHPRRCGLATHLGVVLAIPTIGCSKKMLQVDGITRETVEEELLMISAAANAGASSSSLRSLPHVLPLVGRTGNTTSSQPGALYGYAVHGQRNSVKKCIFVSPGHCVGFAVATALVVSMLHHRIPEPIRAADLGSRAYIRDILTAASRPGGVGGGDGVGDDSTDKLQAA